MTRRFYIETVGCQMNVLDSELVVASLRQAGYELVDSPASADTILFNTCSVRQHAEDKIYSALGRLKHAKQHQPDKIIGVLGCMAQKDQELIFERAPLRRPGRRARPVAPDCRTCWNAIAAGRGPQMEVSLDRKAGNADRDRSESFASYDPLRDRRRCGPRRYQALVRIMIGCDKFCTYCIVPEVRGPEQSRPPEEIVAEVRHLADRGLPARSRCWARRSTATRTRPAAGPLRLSRSAGPAARHRRACGG